MTHTLRRNCFYVGCHNYIEQEVDDAQWRAIMDRPNDYACEQHKKAAKERKRSKEIVDRLDSLAEQGCY